MDLTETTENNWRNKIEQFLARPIIQHGIVFLILLNAVLLGMETSPEIMSQFGELLHILDHAILWIFIAELVLLMSARGLQFFKDPWCLFDFIVIGIALVPASESLAVLRSLRVLRVLRLINKFQSMKKVVRGLLGSLSSLGAVMGLMMVVFYVAAVVSTNLFGKEFSNYFGSLGASLFTLFQVMTLESWADGVARPVMEKFPDAWIFFVIYIMCSTFVVVNLFIAAIVDSFSNSDTETEDRQKLEAEIQREQQAQRLLSEINDEFIAIKTDLHEIKGLLASSFSKN